jgi:hypothetical protein
MNSRSMTRIITISKNMDRLKNEGRPKKMKTLTDDQQTKKRFKGVQDYGFYGSSTPLSLGENSRTCCISSM